MTEILDDNFDNSPASGPKHRHGCMTAWLILAGIGAVATAATYFFIPDMIVEGLRQGNPNADVSTGMLMVLGVLGLANLAAVILLWQYKKTGFYIFCATAAIALVINLMIGLDMVSVLGGLLGIAILYGVLQIKDRGESTWEQLE